MSKRSWKSVENKLEIVLAYLDNQKSISQLCREHEVSDTTIYNWLHKYEVYGAEGLQVSHSWKKYPKELKVQAVQDYLEGKGSQLAVCQNYEISSKSVLMRWVKEYTSGKEIKATSKGLSRMKEGRKTTFEERIEIVNFTLAQGKDYQAAIAKYGVSYNQIYSWLKKFEEGGSPALEDRRGKGLESKPNLTTEEELQVKIKFLEERNRRLEMEVGLLKKLEEIERRNRL